MGSVPMRRRVDMLRVLVRVTGSRDRVGVVRLRRAGHGRRHRTAHRQCDGQQDQEPDAE